MVLCGENTLIYSDSEQIYDINPIIGGSGAERRLQQLMFNGLLQKRKIRYGNHYYIKYVPVVASDFSYHEDRKEYVFTIRDDIPFHGGGFLSPEDVCATLTMLLDE